MQPLVSILIPAFNAERWIAETIASALAQTYDRTEVIVVDDGSTDGTLAIARRCASPRVSVVTQPHQSAAAARNTALSICQGDYLQWLDADDLLTSDKARDATPAVEVRVDPESVRLGSRQTGVAPTAANPIGAGETLGPRIERLGDATAKGPILVVAGLVPAGRGGAGDSAVAVDKRSLRSAAGGRHKGGHYARPGNEWRCIRLPAIHASRRPRWSPFL